jgi:hypothetical protein
MLKAYLSRVQYSHIAALISTLDSPDGKTHNNQIDHILMEKGIQVYFMPMWK